ncbi:MAG: quinone-interacting membrane-bound oxidoreductase complex subunit QmoC [Chloroflexi bacterium]|nr:quinone-interacting membrane-bound oxidoreductase complex subunit QmoC [Chloroflexota bacterium]
MLRSLVQAAPVRPDRSALAELAELAGEAFHRCYQCGTCSVVCPLTPHEQAFPRKEMVWAQWGLTDKLLSDPDVWLCHQCNRCSTYCPTNARPGDLMAAVRNYQIIHYATPSFLAQPAVALKYLPLAFVLPILIVLGIVFTAVVLPNGGFVYPDGPIMFQHWIDHWYIIGASTVAHGFSFLVAAVALRRFWANIQQHAGTEDGQGETRGIVPSFLSTLQDIFSHSRFKDCGADEPRYPAHMGIFYGFLFLFAATNGAFIYTAMGKDLSLPLTDPVKIIGNLGFLLMFGGLTAVTLRRLNQPQSAGRSIYFDWFFIGLLWAVIMTGIFLEAIRMAGLKDIAYPFYLVHLVFIYTLYVYLPVSKFAHLLYRTTALTWAKHVGRLP